MSYQYADILHPLEPVSQFLNKFEDECNCSRIFYRDVTDTEEENQVFWFCPACWEEDEELSHIMPGDD